MATARVGIVRFCELYSTDTALRSFWPSSRKSGLRTGRGTMGGAQALRALLDEAYAAMRDGEAAEAERRAGICVLGGRSREFAWAAIRRGGV
ncbi:hypothetical protein [Vitreimonas flagellata]|uniref:hypothetical protein n=1 Tax=Vitreimonas flagellata TaxID=2560861 RepID=UPI0014309F09|nr:hypothetical protein [Vitreimonas flagellata]